MTDARTTAAAGRGGDRTIVTPLTSVDLCVKQWDRLFPAAQLQKKPGRKLDLHGIFREINKYATDNNATIELDQREGNNGMALNASRNVLHAQRAAAAAPTATVPSNLEDYLFFDPNEMKGAAEGGFAAYQQLTLHKADTPEAAEHFRRQGFKSFTTVQFHITSTSGLGNLPTLAADTTEDGSVPIYQLPAPEGDVNALPKTMPALHSGDISVAAKIVEAFEVKVVDEGRNRIWHPLWLWDADKRKQYQYTDRSNFSSRLNAYFCIK